MNIPKTRVYAVPCIRKHESSAELRSRFAIFYCFFYNELGKGDQVEKKTVIRGEVIKTADKLEYRYSLRIATAVSCKDYEKHILEKPKGKRVR